MTAYIFSDNIIPDSTVTVTSEEDDYPKENAYDQILTDWWQASAAGTVYLYVDYGESVSCDAWSVSGHDLSDNSGTIQPQYSATGVWGGEEVDFDTVQTPATNDPFFRKVDSVSAQYWRYEITSTGTASQIGHLSLGTAIELEREPSVGATPPRQAISAKFLNSISDGGAFIGRSQISQGLEFNIAQNNVTYDWIETNWNDLVDDMLTGTFIYAWNYEDYPLDAVFCWLSGTTVPKPKFTTGLKLNFSIKVNGV
jgi:hypothetical protein